MSKPYIEKKRDFLKKQLDLLKKGETVCEDWIERGLGIVGNSDGMEEPFYPGSEWIYTERASYHEAGHSVASLVLENAQPVQVATRLTTTDADGSTWRYADWDIAKRLSRDVLIDEATVLACGPLAEKIACGDSIAHSSDVDRIERLLFWLPSKASTVLVSEMQKRAKLLLANRWSAVKAVAMALLQEECLTGAEIQRIIDEHPSETQREATEFMDIIKDEFGRALGKPRDEASDSVNVEGQTFSRFGYR